MLVDADISAVWQPIPGSSQALALDSRCHHTLYCGSRGPGKSDCQLMKFRRYVGIGYGSFWRGIIFDREYKNLDDLVVKAKRWFPRFDDGAKWLSAAKDYKWIWPTGEELLFRVIKHPDDYWNYHGHEYPFIGWNELCKYPDSSLYDKMMSCNRTSFTPEKDSPNPSEPLPPIPLVVFSTTNPAGPGHTWVKNRFIDVAPYGEVVKTDTEVFNPRNQQTEVVTKTQVAIFGSYRENIYLSPEYVADLVKITDENLRLAWLTGSWDIVAGGAISDVFDRKTHIIPRFPIPDSWYIDRAFDWGSSHPFYVGWFAEANGETVRVPQPDGSVWEFTPVPGSIILCHEWYGTKKLGTNEGLRLSAPDIAKGITQIEDSLMSNQLGQRAWFPYKPNAGPADNQIRNVREKDVETIEKKMADEGVRWTDSDKSPGSRVNGLQLLRDRLEAAKRGEGPGFYVMQHCSNWISTVPVLPRDERIIDDVDSSAEDHPYDVTRYRVLAGVNRIAKSVKIIFPH